MPAQPPRPSTRERLAAARTREEVIEILGRPRMWRHASAFLALALAAAVCAIYMIANVLAGQMSRWLLAALPAPFAIAAYFGVLAYGVVYFLLRGRRPPSAERIGRIAERLNSNI